MDVVMYVTYGRLFNPYACMVESILLVHTHNVFAIFSCHSDTLNIRVGLYHKLW